MLPRCGSRVVKTRSREKISDRSLSLASCSAYPKERDRFMLFNDVEFMMVGGDEDGIKAFGDRNADSVGEGNSLVDRF
jgi:hypothetical protein